MELDISVDPHVVEDSGDEGEDDGVFEFFIVVEGRVADVLRPGVASKSSHYHST